MEINRDTRLKDLNKSPSGHDVLVRLLYSLGLREDFLKYNPLGLLKIGSLSKLSFGVFDEASIDALLQILNSLPDDDYDEENVEIKEAWWKEAVFYQIYPRSFKDTNDDGIGDIPGIIEKLDYIKSIGVDAIWCCPFYDSPNADNGYDVRNYKKIMKEFGTMSDVDKLIRECHKRDLKIIFDLVMNHTSDEHPWFKKALAGDERYSDYYIWKDEPNNWTSLFAGSAWRYIKEKDKYVLHLFADKQIDLNWDNPQVRQEMYDIANYWLNKGADGFRLDVVSFISKTEGYPDGDPTIGKLMAITGIEHYFHGPHLDEYLREFNKNCLASRDVYTVGECPGNDVMMARMITGDDRHELSQLFAFEQLENPGKTRMDGYEFDFRKSIPELVRWQTKYSKHCWPTLFFNNHDNPRMCSKIDRSDKNSAVISKMLVTILMTLKGTPYLYQGEEIGMTDYPFASISDFKDVETINYYQEYKKNGHDDKKLFKKMCYGSRDNARTPMQWSKEINAGFTQGRPWLKVNPNYPVINVEEEEEDENSVLNHYRKMIRLRKENKALIYGDFHQLKTSKNFFVYYREKDNERFLVIINLTDKVRDPFTIDAKLLASNYHTNSNKIRPYEANVYKTE